MNYSHMLSLTTQQSRTVPSARNKNKHISTSHTNLEEMSPLAVPKIFKSAPVKCTAFSTHLCNCLRDIPLCACLLQILQSNLVGNTKSRDRCTALDGWYTTVIVSRASLAHLKNCLVASKTAVDGWYVTDLFKSRTGIFGSVELQAWQGLEPRVNWPCGTVLAQPESLWIWQHEWRIVRILFPRCPGQSARFFAARWMITPKEKYAENAWEVKCHRHCQETSLRYRELRKKSVSLADSWMWAIKSPI